MPDVVDKTTRSRMMSGIRGKNTKPELAIRSGLHQNGFRFRVHDKRLPGKPDIVLPKYNAVILVNGCFWHGHECQLFRWPSTRPDFWKAKIEGNRRRDNTQKARLQEMGWRVLTIWECALKGSGAMGLESVLEAISIWLTSSNTEGEIIGEGSSQT
ncbi:very short patch repair endonuclease [Lentisalinibacter salinarum]|uniref:very short patch repair endonuclease n=1 Tax=Lentisalinibacter salinarum TaxID=2992239 RepID=UPI00386A251C